LRRTSSLFGLLGSKNPPENSSAEKPETIDEEPDPANPGQHIIEESGHSGTDPAAAQEEEIPNATEEIPSAEGEEPHHEAAQEEPQQAEEPEPVGEEPEKLEEQGKGDLGPQAQEEAIPSAEEAAPEPESIQEEAAAEPEQVDITEALKEEEQSPVEAPD